MVTPFTKKGKRLDWRGEVKGGWFETCFVEESLGHPTGDGNPKTTGNRVLELRGG